MKKNSNFFSDLPMFCLFARRWPVALVSQLLVLMICFTSISAFAQSDTVSAVELTGQENGLSLHGKMQLWFDANEQYSLVQAEQALGDGYFVTFDSARSTGLINGAVWAHFVLYNPLKKSLTIQFEYVDHQLITLDAYAKSQQDLSSFLPIADFSMEQPFNLRKIAHNRFVFSSTILAGQSTEYLVKYSSKGSGYVFPSLRIWTPQNLTNAQTSEIGGFAFLAGGFFLMSVFALILGIITHIRFFYAYSLYSFCKLIAWATILGFTHQFIITQSFHWSYLSVAGGMSIFSGILFTRMFLRSAQFTPWLDKILLFMLANALFLIVCALFKIKALAVMSITLALLLYPVAVITGIKRYLQGSKEALVYSIAWGFLMAGLMTQALRDLGFIDHNVVNYYWPAFASYTEMMVIMVAMGIRVKALREQRNTAELLYRQELEQSKSKLESLVIERTKDLEQQKRHAELEAQTDSLTGTKNRRCFFTESEKLMAQSQTGKLHFSLLMFDIDNFKAINDNFGHALGDQALCKFSEVVSARIRDTDIFARVGGEEFCLLFLGDNQAAMILAERLRKDVSEIELTTAKGSLHFTTSIGVAHFAQEQAIDELIHQADTALYKAKAQGRNQVVCN
jgi:two-component system, sensor histidine kinase LadS